MRRSLLILALALPLGGCATTFTGDAHVSRESCETRCRKEGMELAGMVLMGEYSEGCICQAPGRTASATVPLAAANPAVTGVWMQTQRRQEQN